MEILCNNPDHICGMPPRRKRWACTPSNYKARRTELMDSHLVLIWWISDPFVVTLQRQLRALFAWDGKFLLRNCLGKNNLFFFGLDSFTIAGWWVHTEGYREGGYLSQYRGWRVWGLLPEIQGRYNQTCFTCSSYTAVWFGWHSFFSGSTNRSAIPKDGEFGGC